MDSRATYHQHSALTVMHESGVVTPLRACRPREGLVAEAIRKISYVGSCFRQKRVEAPCSVNPSVANRFNGLPWRGQLPLLCAFPPLLRQVHIVRNGSTVRIAGTTPRLHNLRCTPRGCCKPIRSCRRDGEKVTAATPRLSSDRAPADDGTQGEQRLPAGPIAGRVRSFRRRRSAAANCRAAASVLTARRCLHAA